MQIDRLNTDISTAAHAKPANRKTAKSKVTVEVNQQVSESTILDLATKNQVDSDKVKRAKELLESGNLLSFENILSAAKNVIKSGF